MPSGTRSRALAVGVEAGRQKVFAWVHDWPGWCRAGRGEQAALEALANYVPRYAVVVQAAGIGFPATAGRAFEVVERVTGGATTDFGVPGMVAQSDRRPLTVAAGTRLAALVTAAWTVFDEVVAQSPAALRKGPRGGGRDRDAMVAHVLGAEAMYARKIGVRHTEPAIDDLAAIEALREDIAAVVAAPRTNGDPPVPNGWPVRYAARRIAWHVLDHAWEMQDRAEPSA
jgi:hypothetical protein